MIYARINHNTSYLGCGVLHIYSFYGCEPGTQWQPIDENMFTALVSGKTGASFRNMGAYWAQASFVMSNEVSKKAYDTLVKLLGQPEFQTPERRNENGASKGFTTAIWNLEGKVNSKGEFIKQKEVA